MILSDITETDIIVESRDDKRLHLKGIFVQCDVKNRNGRIYRLTDMEKCVDKYQADFIRKRRALGELNHPDGSYVNPERACILTETLSRDGKNYIGDAITTTSPLGELIYNLVTHDGIMLGVSTRISGSMNNVTGYVNPNFTMNAIDVVTDPSAPDAFVNAIHEQRDYLINSGLMTEQQLQTAKYNKVVSNVYHDLFKKRFSKK